jgi:hypothetical protein
VVKQIDVSKPALVLDVDGASDPSELNASGFGQTHIDRSTVVRANPGITKPAIGWHIGFVPQFSARPEVCAKAVSHHLIGFGIRASAELHGDNEATRVALKQVEPIVA